MAGFVIAAVVMLLALIPCGVVVARGSAMEALVAFEAISAVMVMVLILVSEALRRSGEFELPALLALLMYGSGLVYARFLAEGV